MTRQSVRFLGLTLVVYGLALATIHPFANVFYGGDDWAYAWSARVLQEQHRLRASEFVGAAAVPQTIWAAGFVSLLGADPWVFNLATMLVSVIGVALLYCIGIQLGLRPKNASIQCLAVVLGPLYLGFAGSFMSDMYYLALLLAAVLVYLQALQRRAAWLAAMGGALASLAFLNRQIGLVLPVAFGGAMLVAWYSGRDRRNHALIMIAAGGVCPALTALAYRHFPDAFGGITATQRIKLSPERVWERMLQVPVTMETAYLSVLYVSILLLPLVIIWTPGSRLRSLLASRVWCTSFLLVLAISLTGYFFRVAHGGSFLVRGEFFQTENNGAAPLAGMSRIWTCLAFLGSIAFAVLASSASERLLRAFREARGRQTPGEQGRREELIELVFLVLCLLGHLVLVATFIAFYNNYLLPLAALGAVLAGLVLEASAPPASTKHWLTIALIGLTAVGSVLALDSHVRFVEADRRTADALVASGVDSQDIFGYPSWYAWRNNDLVIAEVRQDPFNAVVHAASRAHYAIMNTEQEPEGKGWHLVGSDAYWTLLGLGKINTWHLGPIAHAHSKR